MRRRLRVLALVSIFTIPVAMGVTACSDSDEPPVPVTGSAPSRPSASAPPGPHLTGTTAGGVTGNEPQIVFFEAPTEVACDGADASVSATFETVNTTAVGFAVDGVSAGGTGPPLSGSYQLSVPCDGNAHTILLVAVGPEGQAVSTQAVRAGTPG